MDFIPLQYMVATPRGGAGAPVASDAQGQDKRVSILVPMALQIDLWEMQGFLAPDPALSYTRDFFVAHWTDASIQRVSISASAALGQIVFSLQLIAKDGPVETDITDQRQYKALPLETDVVEDVFPHFTGALFLRVVSPSQNASLFVTLEVLSTKVF